MSRTSRNEAPVLLWFRTDLRLGDQPALQAALETGQPLLCLYVHDEESAGLRPLGGASKWWLHHSLVSLGERLEALGGRLDIHRGPAGPIVEDLVEAAGVSACFWSRRYGKAERAVDDAVAASLQRRGVRLQTVNGTLLHEPDEVRSKAGGPFHVFTPFRKAAVALGLPPSPCPAPTAIRVAPRPRDLASATTVADLGLLPTKPDWATGFRETWTPGEPAATRLLHAFLDGGLARYGEDRNRPSVAATSRLSPHLRFGEISARQVIGLAQHAAARGTAPQAEVDKFVSEVIWRDFAYNLLVQHPDIATEPVQAQFSRFPYGTVSPDMLRAWETGHTGYPIVDAGMRQLWQTGTMHNRVRMITASFLVKHLLADWRIGEAWFWDTLCDADPANNPVNWQWVAGSGADPSPYFRIFNPTLQGAKFDPKGAYVRRFVPELDRLPGRWSHEPWTAPAAVLAEAGVVLGKTYPHPIVDHEAARARALAALAAMRGSGGPDVELAR